MPLNVGCSARPGKPGRTEPVPGASSNRGSSPEKCTRCGICRTICPEGCIRHLEKKQYESDPEYCKGCGMCAAACPTKAITMTEEHR